MKIEPGKIYNQGIGVEEVGEYKGFEYVIAFNIMLGCYLAYVNTYQFDIQEDELLMPHGGITYKSGKLHIGDIEGNWIGWDFCHFNDILLNEEDWDKWIAKVDDELKQRIELYREKQEQLKIYEEPEYISLDRVRDDVKEVIDEIIEKKVKNIENR